MNEFEIVIITYINTHKSVAEIYYSNFLWAEIYRKDKKLAIDFHPHPNKSFWEFSFDEALKILEKAKNKLFKKLREANSFNMEQIDPTKVNEQAQEILEKILNHSEKRLIFVELSRFGKVVDIYAPDIGGARYTADCSEFICFLEPVK